MKAILPVLFMYAVISCSAPPSQETSSQQDTTSAKPTVDSVTAETIVVVEKPAPSPLVISDSTASILYDVIKGQFEKIYADSSNYYKITYTDYYDEYEGQATMRHSIWYLDKNFSIVYSMHDWMDGAMDKPDVDEYVIKDKSIVSAKADYRGEYGERKLLLWNGEAGNVELALSSYDQKTKSKGPIPADYITKAKKEWDANLTILLYDLEEDKVDFLGGEIYTISTETPKPPDLKDYTVLTIPKVVFNKLRSDRDK